MKKGKQLAQLIDRRSFLKGMGTLMVGLPLMDFMVGNSGEVMAATGTALPQRLIIMFNGISIGFGGTNPPEMVSPTTIGANYALTPGLQALSMPEFAGLQAYTSVVSNMKIPWKPWGDNTNQDPGLDGMCAMFHRGASMVQLTGYRAWETSYKQWKDSLKPTADSVYSNSLGSGFRPFCYSVEAENYFYPDSFNHDFKNLSGRFYGLDVQIDMNGNIVYPYNIPQNAYNALMNLTAGSQGTQTTQNTAVISDLTRNKSVLDFLDLRRLQYLKNELSASDQKKLSDHFDQIRTLERSIAASAPPAPALTCSVPQANLNTPALNLQSHYSGEDERSKLWADIILLGFKCDANRAGTLLITGSSSGLSVAAETGQNHFYHDTSHGPVNNELGLANFTKMYNWHTKVMLRVAKKLKDTAEGAGNMLDNTAIVLASEGGSGLSTDAGDGVGARQAHSVENMVSLVCGKAGGLKGNVHVRTNQAHPTKAIISAMKAVGGPQSLGAVTGIIPELFNAV